MVSPILQAIRPHAHYARFCAIWQSQTPTPKTATGKLLKKPLEFPRHLGIIPVPIKGHAPVAQLDRASVYGTEGCRFESCRACETLANRECFFVAAERATPASEKVGYRPESWLAKKFVRFLPQNPKMPPCYKFLAIIMKSTFTKNPITSSKSTISPPKTPKSPRYSFKIAAHHQIARRSFPIGFIFA